MSDTLTIETANTYQPFVSGYAQISGEGNDASIVHILVKWVVGSDDDIDKYEIYRDGSLIYTENSSYESEFRDTDTKNFEQEYNYKVLVYTSTETYTSDIFSVTPHRPDEEYREVPEILKITSNSTTKTITVTISDVSETENNLIDYSGSLEGTNYTWDTEVKVSELSTDEEGNLQIILNAEGASLPSGQTIWLTSKVRIYINGGWSDWSDYNRSFVF
jgi:hypothetical protein